jgi:hypothetical protein
MSNTYTWNISALDCAPSAEGQTEVVQTVHWECIATSTETYTNQQGQTVPYTARIYSTCPVTYTQGSPFTAYSSLTKQEVLTWIWGNGVNETATQTALDAMIQSQITPAIVTPVLPFSN